MAARKSFGANLATALATAVLFTLLLAISAPAWAAESTGKPPADEAIDLFAAAEAGQVEVRIIPRDEKQARILVTNKTKEPLSIRLPEAFAARPILAQFRGFQLPNGQNQHATNQAPQTFGGPVNMNNGQNGNQQRRNGVFNIPPEQTRDVKVTAVCLEHGKPHPRPQHSYELLPLASYSSDPKLAGVLDRLGQGKCSQRVAQAATWNLTSDRSWDQLAKEPGELIGVGEHAPYFTKRELQEAKDLVAAVVRELSPPKTEAAAAKSLITTPTTSANRYGND